MYSQRAVTTGSQKSAGALSSEIDGRPCPVADWRDGSGRYSSPVSAASSLNAALWISCKCDSHNDEVIITVKAPRMALSPSVPIGLKWILDPVKGTGNPERQFSDPVLSQSG